MSRMGSIGAFTEREVEIAKMVADGLRNGDIAACLNVSENTVRYHLKELYSRLGTSSRVVLARAFIGGEISSGKGSSHS